MSDAIKHECGIALVRLKRPLAYYQEVHGTPLWGLQRLYLLMEKQRNRGQDGAGLCVLRQGIAHGAQYLHRERQHGASCLDRLWKTVHDEVARAQKIAKSADELKRLCPYLGEVHMGHLRYGTHGANGIDNCHPYLRPSNWPTRLLTVAGNFNLTNTDQLFDMLVQLGQHPTGEADTATVMEKIGHFLEEANEAILRQLDGKGLRGAALVEAIGNELDVAKVLRRSARAWDGGYLMAGIIGHGASFVLRDPSAIRPGFWYEDDEVVAVASERAALLTCFNLNPEAVREITPGHALIISHKGEAKEHEIVPRRERRSCTFERIYFSRGNDADIYRERKRLGAELAGPLAEAVDGDLAGTVISYVPNTAESAYYGLLEGLDAHLAVWMEREIIRLQAEGPLTPERLRPVLSARVWQEKAAHKDAKLRTFITGEDDRGDLVAHAYDVTRGILEPGKHNLAVIDDSIVRGTTLRQSIIRMLSRLGPKRLVILSSAPQIRYPDCYGIDMSELGKFVAFEAAVSLLRERGQARVLDDVYEACKAEEARAQQGGTPQDINHVKRVYAPFSDAEVSAKVAELVRPKDITWNGTLTVVFQTVAGLRRAIPGHTGDWYFTGDYPTPGGYRVVNRAFINFMERRTGRAYERAAG
jgi:amidophosphoribosyltransferase